MSEPTTNNEVRMTIEISGANWTEKMVIALKACETGDIIRVDSADKLEMMIRAMRRMNIEPERRVDQLSIEVRRV
jgi:tRNA1(Val) A37 N6-methylase TrmN6